VPESPVKVWRGSLAGNPGLVPASPPFRFDVESRLLAGDANVSVDREE
jgi:hypothetical protein